MTSDDLSRIYIVHSSEPPRRLLKQLDSDGLKQDDARSVKWLYLGRSYLRLREWEIVLGERCVRISYSEALQELAAKWRRPFMSWIAEQGKERRKSIVWWSSRVAEMNTLLDSLYHTVCYLKVGLILCNDESVPLIVVAESRAVLRAIGSHAQLRARCRWTSNWGSVYGRLKWGVRFVVRWLFYLADAFLARRDAGATRISGSPRPPSTERSRILIHTFVDEACFNSDGSFSDRYFTVLPDELRRRGYDVHVIPCLFNIRRSRREAFEYFRERSDQFVIPEDYYTFGDHIWAAWVVIRQAWLLSGQFHFEGVDVSKVVREACLEQSLDVDTAKFVRYYSFVKRSGEAGLQFDIFIDTFENMIAEKPIVMAFREFSPETLTVGFQHYSSPCPLLLCVFSTPEANQIAPYPDVIVCNSPWSAKIFASEGYPVEKLRSGPSLRYLYLEDLPAEGVGGGDAVLVVLSLDTSASTELLHKLLDAFGNDEEIEFRIKPHPMMSEEEWRDLLGGRRLPSHMKRIGGAMGDWLKNASCAVVSASSSAMELALAGVPVILVGRETDFDMNPLHWFDDLARPVYTAEQLRRRVMEVLDSRDSEREQFRNWSLKARAECLSPVNDETISAFLTPPSDWPATEIV